MITSAELELLLERVREHRDEEPEFFRVLLNATVYAHAPLSDDHLRLRLIQFRHPDGFYAVPFFTSEAKAVLAAQASARVISCTGRELLELTRGATLMLNPNDGGCVLYPEEIDALLSSGLVANVEKGELTQGQSLWVGIPERPPSWLMSTLARVFSSLPAVEAAYLIDARPQERPEDASLLVVMAVSGQDAERAARACLTALQPYLRTELPFSLDLTAYDPSGCRPSYVADSGAEPFYVRPTPRGAKAS